jgi:hypothetical protein
MTETPAPAASRSPRRCRSLTVRGRQCLAVAMHGHEFCVAHGRHRFPVCPQGDKIAIPLLEDLDTIQVVATQVAHGLFSEVLDPWRAGKILYALQVAALTIPRPAPLKPSEEKPIINEPVTQTFPGLDGSLLGPDLPWKGNDAAFNPIWSFDRRRYAEECEPVGKPAPVTPEDFPESGWLTKEEMKEFNPRRPDIMSGKFLDEILQMRLEEERRGKLPPLYRRTCSYNHPVCRGPWDMGRDHSPCERCSQERKERIRLHPEEDVEVINCATELGTSEDPLGLKPTMRTDLPKLASCQGRRGGAAAHPVPRPAPCPAPDPAPAPAPARPGALGDLNAAAEPAPSRHRETAFPRVKLDNTAKVMIPKPHPPSTSPGGRGVAHTRRHVHDDKRQGGRFRRRQGAGLKERQGTGLRRLDLERTPPRQDLTPNP